MKNNNQNQVRTNLVFNIASLVLNIIIGLVYSPYLIKNLGIIAYGVLPLALVVSHYISIITVSLTSSLARFYSVSLQKGNVEEASRYLNTAFWVVLILAIILSIPLYLIVVNIEHIFNIPSNLVGSARILFAFTFISFPIALLETVLNISLYAYNRLDYLNIIKSFRIVFKFAFVYALFFYIEKDIAYVGIANFLTEVGVLLISFFFFRKLTKETIVLNLKLFERSSLITMAVMAVWVIIQQLGETLLFRIDNIVVNQFWSTKESGILGAFTELGTYTLVIATVIGSLFGPLILKSYSDDNHLEVQKLTLDHSLSIGILTAVVIGVLCGFSPTILKLWLGKEFVEYNLWLYIKLFLVPFSCSASMFAFALRTWNRVKYPALITVLIGFLNLVSVWLIGNYFSSSKFAVEYILVICLLFGIFQTYILNGYLFFKIYKNTFKDVIINFFKILAVLVFVSAVCYFVDKSLIHLNPILALSIIGLVGIFSLIISFYIGLSKDQKNGLLNIVFKS